MFICASEHNHSALNRLPHLNGRTGIFSAMFVQPNADPMESIRIKPQYLKWVSSKLSFLFIVSCDPAILWSSFHS